MKKWMIFAFILLPVACFSIMIAVVFNMMNSYESVVKANWGVDMPKGAGFKEVYKQTSGASFNGDGIRYHVFSYKQEKDVEDMLPWISFDQPTIFYSNIEETAKHWLSDISVPLEKCPDFSKCVYWYEHQDDNSEILIFWDSDAERFYIVEEFL